MEDNDQTNNLGAVEDEIGSRVGNTDDLPKEILEQLSSVQLDALESKILAVLKEKYGGAANLDEVIVGLYREYKYVSGNRRDINNKLYRMMKKGILSSVPKKKGAYKVAT
jgi:hypothetical protein